MNKKFSTLLAGVALFGATSAFAGNNVPSLIEGTNDGLYQLKTPGNLYLAVNAKGELVTVDNVTADNVASTLWCTTVTVENQGKAPIYDFVNKGAEALLSVTMDDFAKNARTHWLEVKLQAGHSLEHMLMLWKLTDRCILISKKTLLSA